MQQTALQKILTDSNSIDDDNTTAKYKDVEIFGRRILGKDYSAKHIIRWSRATNLLLFFYSSNTNNYL